MKIFTQAEKLEMEATYHRLYGHHGADTDSETWPYYTDLVRDIREHFSHIVGDSPYDGDRLDALSLSCKIVGDIIRSNGGKL